MAIALGPGMVLRHHSGRVYTILHIANTATHNPDKFPVTVVYQGASGKVWTRPLAGFSGKFTILFDGHNLAPAPEED